MFLLVAPVLAAAPVVGRFADYPLEQLFTVSNGRVDTASEEGAPVYRWHPDVGTTSLLALKADNPLLARLRFFDRFDFEFRIAGEISEMGLSALGNVSAARQSKVHQWSIAVRTTESGVWHARSLELSRPNWFPWDNPDGEDAECFFRFDVLALTPGTVIELRAARLTRGMLLLKPDYELPVTWPVANKRADGGVRYTLHYQVLNAAGKPTTITAAVRSTHKRFTVNFDTPTIAVKAAEIATFTLTAEMSKADIDAAEELYTEPLHVEFTPACAPDAVCCWNGELVRPLSAGLKRQVIISEDDLTTVRNELKAGNAAMKSLIGLDQVVAAADQLVEKRLVHIPTGHARVTNNWPGDWRPGDAMPEAVNEKTGERQFDTELAGHVWKEYLGYLGGACENLGMAYLLTGDEKYAKKAIELFLLYAQQYGEQHWANGFDPAWNDGPAILCSSRVSTTSSYGSNWYFKGHCALLSKIADSPSWTEEQRARVYQDFVLPYAEEIMKFPGGLNNMTDITNKNILLLGVACNDASLVRWATMNDSGLLARLRDIDRDGFSSEGRPA